MVEGAETKLKRRKNKITKAKSGRESGQTGTGVVEMMEGLGDNGKDLVWLMPEVSQEETAP